MSNIIEFPIVEVKIKVAEDRYKRVRDRHYHRRVCMPIISCESPLPFCTETINGRTRAYVHKDGSFNLYPYSKDQEGY
jgi:hypothetical protein